MANAVTGIYRRWIGGTFEEARELPFALIRLQGCLEGIPYVAGVKHLVERRGHPGRATRAPQPGAHGGAEGRARRPGGRDPPPRALALAGVRAMIWPARLTLTP